MQKVTFYTKLSSSICEKAHLMLMELTYDLPLEVDIVDVNHAHNQEFRAIYGERIPVITKPESTKELDWPFTLEDIRNYLMGQ